MRRLIVAFTVPAVLGLAGTAAAQNVTVGKPDVCHVVHQAIAYDDGTSAQPCAPGDMYPSVFMACNDASAVWPAAFVVVFYSRQGNRYALSQWRTTSTGDHEHAMGEGVIELLGADTVADQGSGYDGTGWDAPATYGYNLVDLPVHTVAAFDAIAADQCSGVAIPFTAATPDLEHTAAPSAAAKCQLTQNTVAYQDGTSGPVCGTDGPQVYMACTPEDPYLADFFVVFTYRARDLTGDAWKGRKWVAAQFNTRDNVDEHAMGLGVWEIITPDTVEYQGIYVDNTGWDPFRDYSYGLNVLPIKTQAEAVAFFDQAAQQCTGTATPWTADTPDLFHPVTVG